MTIGTLKAEAKVLGTTLDLAATTNETRLDVIKGEVELIRQEDGASIQTKSGYASVVDGGTELRLKRLLPAPWTSQDIGNSLVAGSAHCDEGVFTLRGSGDDIWNEADGFHYAFQPLEGDGEIEARVLTMQDTEWQAKAGLMIRESLSAESRNAAITVTPGHDIWFHYRPAGGGRSLSIQRGIDHAPDGKAIEAHAPYWLKLVRQAETFISYCSADGKDWQQVAAETIPMGRKVYVGLAVSSHNNPVLNTSSFDNVALKPVDESDNQPPAYEFNVDGDREGWTLHRLTEVNGGPRNGTWICNAATNYPWFMGPVMHLDATACARVKIRMADFGPSVTNSMLKIYWRRRDDAKFSESRNKATRIKNTGEWTDYTLDMSRHADWNGDIVQIRIDPIGAGDAHNVGLDYVRFEKQPK
jgi:hypothetical protein